MKKERKIGLFWIIATIAILSFFAIPGEITMDIWIPGNDTVIANEISKGNYIDISEIYISGTAVKISMENYQQKYYLGAFIENSIVIEKSTEDFGEDLKGIYYIGKTKEMVYITDLMYPERLQFLTVPQVFINGDDKENLKIRLVYKPVWIAIILFSLVSITMFMMIMMILVASKAT